jgi:hypothetical protein
MLLPNFYQGNTVTLPPSPLYTPVSHINLMKFKAVVNQMYY